MKSKEVDFYVASATGNTLLCAEKIAEIFNKNNIKTVLKKIENGYTDSNAAIGIAMPVICFSAFPFVWKFIDSLPDGCGKEAFFMSTYGLKHHDVQSAVGKVLKKKGYKLLGAANIFMPHNLFDRNKSKEYFEPLIGKGLKEAENFADGILENKAVWAKGGFASKIKTAVNKSGWFWNLFRKKLQIYCDTAKCVKCSKCVTMCPVGNIYMKEYPAFKGICEACSRCVAFCPEHALDFKGKEAPQYRAVEYKEML